MVPMLPLIFKCIKQHPAVMADITVYAEECFNFKEHAENTIFACKQVYYSEDPQDIDNVFAIYTSAGEFVGVTGLWYDDRPPLDKLAFLRWTDIRLKMRRQGLSKPLIEHLWYCAKVKDRHTLVEIAHTDIAKLTFQNMGFSLVWNNDRYIKPLLTCLNEPAGAYILTKALPGAPTIDWEDIINLAETNTI